ncbi:uncharacterized protein LOC121430905 [Lytechinus variegatus]|uniref:uncharacterized protein LOC121430905 n=1 Tax=Lytechinus variegatus TaxID=7654 RepID=UPI001BB13A31|nr:uncharacterized protein LOC121430905 [Lytechinus variegatus]
MFYNASDAKLYGYRTILEPLVNDLNMLADVGIDIRTTRYHGNIKVALGQVVGDNLGLNGVLGFTEGFTANHFCRRCTIHRNEAKTCLSENRLMMRNREQFVEDLALNNPQETGIKLDSPLNSISNFHVTSNAVPDIMHDLLEGICPLELKLVLKKLISDGHFSLTTVNSRITSFNYGAPDSKNKPTVLTEHALIHPDGCTGQSAAQMWCLMRHISVILGDLIPEENRYWDLILVLLDCMDIIFSPLCSLQDCIYLKHLISDNHNLFLQLFPERHLKPKHHFMTHYPNAMKAVGPLKNFWTMRFEGNHNFSKRLSHITCNFQNMGKTLAFRHQLALCYKLLANECEKKTDTEVGPGSSVLVMSLEASDLLSDELHIAMHDDVYVAKWCKAFGTEYRPNVMVVVAKTPVGDPVFGKVCHVVVTENVVVLVYEQWDTNGYKRHYHAYEIAPHQPRSFGLCAVGNLIDFHPLHAVQPYNGFGHLISLRYRIL